MKRHAKVDLASHGNDSNRGICYLDANNLYGGAMHRTMPYELESIQNEEKILDNVYRNPIKWVQSLKTFGKYGFFIECDIEAPVELHDKFNDLPFFPVQKAGMYSDGIKKYAEKNDIMNKVKETNTPN